jgi:hypothetical protein
MQAGKKLAPWGVNTQGKEFVLEGMLLTAWIVNSLSSTFDQ